MSKVVFTEAQAKRIWAATKQLEQMSQSAVGYDRFVRNAPRDLPVYIRNDTGAALKPYSPVVVSSFEFTDVAENEGRVEVVASARRPVSAVRHGFAGGPSCTRSHEQQLRSQIVLWTGAELIQPNETGLAQRGDIVISRYVGTNSQGEEVQRNRAKQFTPTVSVLPYRDYVVPTRTSKQVGNEFPQVGCAVFLGMLNERASRFYGDQRKEDIEPLPEIETTDSGPISPPGLSVEQIDLALIQPFNNFQSTAWAYVELLADTVVDKQCSAKMIYASGDYWPSVQVTVAFTTDPTSLFEKDEEDNLQNLNAWVFRPSSPLNYQYRFETGSGTISPEGGNDQNEQSSDISDYYPADNVYFFPGGGPTSCDAVEDCVDEFICEKLIGCLDEEEVKTKFCELVKECLDIEDDEDIDDRIDQRLDELTNTVEALTDCGANNNNLEFDKITICYVRAPSCEEEAAQPCIIEGTDCNTQPAAINTTMQDLLDSIERLENKVKKLEAMQK